MTDAVRTPDERFEGLPDFPWQPAYREWEGLRLAHLDEGGDGGGETIVMLHGEPTWSFLWRKVMVPLVDAGHRCIAPDLPGFGRSDKPTDMDWYSYDRHTAAIADLFGELGLAGGVTLVVHDWGGPIGLRVAAEHPEWIERLVVMDTGVFTGHQKMSDAWKAFRDFVQRTPDLPIGMLIQGACATDVPDEVIAGYEAPFPSPESKAGARAFPLMLATTPDAPGAEAGRRALEALEASSPPALCLWADSDPIITPKMGARLAEKIGWPEPEPVENASHFLQEDQGEAIGKRIAAWLAAS